MTGGKVVERLKKAGIENAGFEARLLAQTSNPEESLKRRIVGEPLQYILGEWEFYGHDFVIGPGVLIPRQDTETLCDAVIKRYKGRKMLEGVDLCAGSGCIAVTLSLELNASFTAIEKSDEAFDYLQKNNALHGYPVQTVKADALVCPPGFSDLDLIVCNPPYLTADDMKSLQKEVRFEPELALFGGKDGLYFYRALTETWKDSLKRGGGLFYEVGFGQADCVADILRQNGFENVQIQKDLCGVERVVFGFFK